MNGFLLKTVMLAAVFIAPTSSGAVDDHFESLVADFYSELISHDGQGYEDAGAIAEEMLSLGNQKNNDSWRVRGLIRLAFIEIYYGKWQNNFGEKLKRCEKLIAGFGNDIAHAEFYMFRGYMLGKWQDDIPGGIEKLKKAILLAEQLRDDEVLARSFSLVSSLYGFDGDEKRMLEYAERGYIIANEHGSHTNKCVTLSFLISVLHETGQIERATELAHVLKKIRPTSGRARWVLFCAGQDDEFLEMVEKKAALHLSVPKEEMSAVQAESVASHNLYLARAYKKLGRLESAAKSCRIAIEHFKISVNENGRRHAEDSRIMIEIMMIQDDLQRLNSLVKALDDSGYTSAGRPDWCLDIARAYERLGEHEQTVNWLKKHLELSNDTTESGYHNIVTAAHDYWEGERQARDLFDLANEQKRKSQFAYYLLIFVSTAALCLMSIGYMWLRGTRNQKDKLAGLVDERTRSLIEANKKSNAANEAKSEFLARVNHEIRNPLTAILGYSELLMLTDAEKGSKQETLTSGLMASSRHLLELVDDVLVVSRIENNEIESHRHEFYLHDTIEDINQMMSDLAKDKSLDFECYVDADCDYQLFGDETKLRQIILNLISNAIKFTDHGKVSAVLQLQRTGDDQVILEVNVRDTGTGIPAEIQPTIFEKFCRGSHQVDGTGLGLHICKKLATHLGGTIELESGDSGTSFVVNVPFEVVKGTEKRVTRDRPVQHEDIRTKILIVDDQISIRETICMRLQTAGFEPKASCSLDETIELIEKWQPKIVLLDLRMPEQDGFAIQSAIRNRELDVYIVAMTGDATDLVRQKCEAHGFDGFLTKPFQINCVKELTERLMLESGNERRNLSRQSD